MRQRWAKHVVYSCLFVSMCSVLFACTCKYKSGCACHSWPVTPMQEDLRAYNLSSNFVVTRKEQKNNSSAIAADVYNLSQCTSPTCPTCPICPTLVAVKMPATQAQKCGSELRAKRHCDRQWINASTKQFLKVQYACKAVRLAELDVCVYVYACPAHGLDRTGWMALVAQSLPLRFWWNPGWWDGPWQNSSNCRLSGLPEVHKPRRGELGGNWETLRAMEKPAENPLQAAAFWELGAFLHYL